MLHSLDSFGFRRDSPSETLRDGDAAPPGQRLPVRPGHALVLGSSMAGLLAARVLADRFERVTLVERDRLPDCPISRPGLPQGHHVHVLLAKGQTTLESLFPGIQEDLAREGAPQVNWTADCKMLGWGGWTPRFESDLTTRTCSRDLLEWVLRRRLAAATNLTWLTPYQVRRLTADAEDCPSRITGAVLKGPAGERAIAADLVVDATGRNSQVPQWLAPLGYAPPPETLVDARLGYASRWYEIPPDSCQDWKALLIWAKPPRDTRAGVLYPIGGNRWVVTVSGVGGDYPPRDEAGFLEFVRSLRDRSIYNAIRRARPLTDICVHRGTANRLRHYERLDRFPEGLAVLGDAACAFNPIYGQGMTAAALAALVLGDSLDRHGRPDGTLDLAGLSRQFRCRLARTLRVPWVLATGEDLRWATTLGAQPDYFTRALQRYIDRVLQLTARHPRIHETVWKVQHMVAPPAALFHPAIALQVMRAG